MSSGYSKTPLVKKLGIKPGFKCWLINPISDYEKLLGELPWGVSFYENSENEFDFIHAFVLERTTLEEGFLTWKNQLKKDGSLWISWPKKTSSLNQGLDGNEVREIGLLGGLVDVKVCAVDDNWSGLKFMFRQKDR